MRWVKFAVYRHIDNLDVDWIVYNIGFLGASYVTVKLKPVYRKEHYYAGHALSAPTTHRIQRKDMKNWQNVTFLYI